MKRGGRLSPTSKKRLRDLPRRRKVRQAVLERDGGCLLSPYGDLNPAGWDWGPCLGELTPHHLVKASHGGEYTERNLVTLCAMHNDEVEDYPVPARGIGLVFSTAEERDRYQAAHVKVLGYE